MCWREEEATGATVAAAAAEAARAATGCFHGLFLQQATQKTRLARNSGRAESTCLQYGKSAERERRPRRLERQHLKKTCSHELLPLPRYKIHHGSGHDHRQPSAAEVCFVDYLARIKSVYPLRQTLHDAGKSAAPAVLLNAGKGLQCNRRTILRQAQMSGIPFSKLISSAFLSFL